MEEVDENIAKNKSREEKKNVLRLLEEESDNKIFKKLWEHKIAKISQKSRFKNFKSYKLRPVIFKGGDDLR